MVVLLFEEEEIIKVTLDVEIHAHTFIVGGNWVAVKSIPSLQNFE